MPFSRHAATAPRLGWVKGEPKSVSPAMRSKELLHSKLPLSGEVARSADRVKEAATLQPPCGDSSPTGVPGEQSSPGVGGRGA